MSRYSYEPSITCPFCQKPGALIKNNRAYCQDHARCGGVYDLPRRRVRRYRPTKRLLNRMEG